MSVWSGIAAAGVAIALALFAVGQPLWEWRMESPQQREVWSYRPFDARHEVFNKTTNQTDVSRLYTYDRLASLQPSMASVFTEFERFFVLGLIATLAGIALAVVSYWKKIRGIFAGGAFLGASSSWLYAVFTIVFTVPPAATATASLNRLGTGFPDFRGQALSGDGLTLLTWTPLIGWALPIVAGLALAWASSDLWHILPVKRAAPAKAVPAAFVVKPVRTAERLPPPPPMQVVVDIPPEPSIEEVFLIGANGLLIKHMSRSLMSDKDRDVVGSMISAISSFVREAFSERDGEVHEVSLGDHRFVMANDGGLVAAVLVKAGKTEDIVHRLRHLLALLRDRYGERLMDWQGEPIEGIEDELSVLWEAFHLPPPPSARWGK